MPHGGHRTPFCRGTPRALQGRLPHVYIDKCSLFSSVVLLIESCCWAALAPTRQVALSNVAAGCCAAEAPFLPVPRHLSCAPPLLPTRRLRCMYVLHPCFLPCHLCHPRALHYGSPFYEALLTNATDAHESSEMGNATFEFKLCLKFGDRPAQSAPRVAPHAAKARRAAAGAHQPAAARVSTAYQGWLRGGARKRDGNVPC